MALTKAALDILDELEAIEMRSLEWGFTDGSLSERDLEEVLGRVVADQSIADDAVEELIDAHLIFELHTPHGVRLRSRFAELMRLLAANRQLFPGKPWQNAPRLVADFRVDRRPRRFPMRNRSAADVLSEQALLRQTPLRTALWTGLTSSQSIRLSGFQERALTRLLVPGTDSGTIVTAGTGSGKTLAFYLPAMIRVGEAIGSERWVKAIAIYPRVELLKDQFSEAFRMARSIDHVLAGIGRRKLSVGALFRATPRRASEEELQDKEWVGRGPNYVCPWMRCPQCGGELVWRLSDVQAGTERLFCGVAGCNGAVAEDEIVLTRQRLQKEPTDVLFTTTEILNQRLSDTWMRSLFGVGKAGGRKPFFALLDEVHTYEGASGAQAALTLRRWRHALSAPMDWVGLSATLGDAARFFADLTGAEAERVVEISPLVEEMEEEGAEYQILLRGDPTSRASLLSTTIQTSMLVPRALDPPGAVASGSFGRRAFLFTDDLDVTNRLFDDLRDAEAYTMFGRADASRAPLANMRGPGADAVFRDLEAQRWRMCEDIGHPLNQRLVVGRTTSQDAGVNNQANIVVATAALEVGYNDPFVGAVIQHKAPRSMASFLQRKGRAGRSRSMRPMILTVLSDYGRDRIFFQAYEQLFDPTLETQHLPIRNPHVLKIQSVFAMFDWLAAKTASEARAWQWDILSRPIVSPGAALQGALSATRAKLSALVQGDASLVEDLRLHLKGALGVDDAIADSLLWEAPRSLLLEAAPTLVRRLFRNWELAHPNAGVTRDIQVDYHPLPDFVPRNLFNDLNLPEVQVVIPPATVNHAPRLESMGIVAALNQLAPGRVTRRFAFERGQLSHWVPVDPSMPEQERPISGYAQESEFVGQFVARCNGATIHAPVPVFRPWTINLAIATRSDALPSSNARLVWQTDIEANGDGLSVPTPPRSVWRQYVDGINFYLHRFRAGVSTRRFARTVHANIRRLQDDFPVVLNFTDDHGQPAAIGFELGVDGLRFTLSLEAMNDALTQSLPERALNAARLSYLRDAFLDDEGLPVGLNSFQREWLFQLLISTVLADASGNGRTLAQAIDEVLAEGRLQDVFRATMEHVFGAVAPAVADDDDNDAVDADDQAPPAHGGGLHTPSRLQQALAQHLADPVVRERLRVLGQEWVNPDPGEFSAWLRRLVVNTLGQAMLQACIGAAPRQAATDTLLVDIHHDAANGLAHVWITETTPGGAGALEAFAEKMAADPNVFFAALEAALAPQDLELVDGSLREILSRVVDDAGLTILLAQLRATQSHTERGALWRDVCDRLSRRGGVDLSHALAVAFSNRLLRTGASPQLDRLLLDLQSYWDELETRFGISIGLREFAYVAAYTPQYATQVRAFLRATLPADAAAQVSVMSALNNLLWPRASEVRQRALHSYNPYRTSPATDPAIVRHLLLGRSIPLIALSDPDWRVQVGEAFREFGTCKLITGLSGAAELRAAIVELFATPIDVGVLQFFAVLEGFERSDGQIAAGLTLREQV